MIRRVPVINWFSLQMTSAATGCAAVMISPYAALLFPLLLLLVWFTLQLGWKTRQEPERNKPIADGIAVLGLAIFLFLLFKLNLLVALGALLFVAALALNVQLHTYRRFYFAQVMSFIFVLVGAAEATSGFYLLAIIAYSLFAAFSLGEAWLDQGEQIEHHEKNEVVPKTASQHRVFVTAVILILAFAFYLVIPRPPALNFGGQESSAGDFYHDDDWQKHADDNVPPPPKKSESNEVEDQRTRLDNFNEITDLSSYGDDGSDYEYDGFNSQFDIRDTMASKAGIDLNAIVARMKAPHGSYLKVRTFNYFDGESWSSTNENISRKVNTNFIGKVDLDVTRKGNFQQVITIERNMPAWLPAAADPVSIWVPASVIALDQFNQPLLPGVLRPNTRYTVKSALELVDNRPISRAPPPESEDLQLTKNFDGRIRKLAREVTRKHSGSYAKAIALETHLRSEYQYSFASITQSQGRTPLSKFLFVDKQGHCEYFASAMTIMLRSLGIPARLVTGFSVNNKNPLTGYFEIRAIDGHAWTEAWIDGRWVTFEPTAYYQIPSSQESVFAAEQISQYAQQVVQLSQVGDSQEFNLGAILSALWLALYTGVVIIAAYIKLFLLNAWPLLLLMCVILFAGWRFQPYWLPYLRAYMSARKIQAYTPNNAPDALYFYMYHLQRMAQKHTPKRQSSVEIEDWLSVVENQYGHLSAMRTLAHCVHNTFYLGEYSDLEQIQQAALAAVEELKS